MVDSGDFVNCETHGEAAATFLCQHLSLSSKGLGFNIGRDPEKPDQPFPDAWCDECERIWKAEGGWNENSMAFANIKVVCGNCYQEIRVRNWLQDEKKWKEFQTERCQDLSLRQEKFIKDFQIEDCERWERNQDKGLLVFFKKDLPQVEAEFHFVGSFSQKSNTWMWAWANDSFSEKTRTASRKARELGERNKFLPLIEHISFSTEEQAGHFTAILAKELDAIGSYKNVEDELAIYMIITRARLVKRKKFWGNFGKKE